MSLAIQDFWKLAIDSQLLSPEDCQRLATSFGQIKGADHGNAKLLTTWLIDQRVLTRYQSKVLLARRPGPFLFGDYKVHDKIKGGRLDGLFRAVHQPTRQPVCLQFLSGAATQDAQAIPRLRLQFAVVATPHPHLARCYEWMEWGSYKFAVLADLQGKSLDELLAEKARLPYAEACQIARQAALALSHLHQHGQMHGEVRPQNIWIEPSGNARLLYAPLWRDPLAGPTLATFANPQPTEQQLLAADYEAPELAGGGAWPDARSDVYSLGCMLFQMLAGRAPTSGGDVTQKLRRHATENFHAVNLINPQVPPQVAQVVNYLLAKDPGTRYQQAAHAADALAAYLDPAAAPLPAEQNTPASQAFEGWLQRIAANTLPQSAGYAQPAYPSGYQPGYQQPSYQQPAYNQPAYQQPAYAPQAAPFAPAQGAPMYGGGNSPAAAVAFAPQPQAVAQAPQPHAAPAIQTAPGNIGQTAPKPSFVGPVSTARGSSLVAERRAVKKSEWKNQIIAGVCVGGLLLIVAVIAAMNRPKRPSPGLGTMAVAAPTNVSPNIPANGNTAIPNLPATTVNPVVEPSAKPPADSSEPAQEHVEGLDGELIWESPTAGQPLDLAYFPPGVQLFVALRPAAMTANPQWQTIIETSEITGPLVRDRLLKLGGAAPENIEQAVFGFLDAGAGKPPLMALVVRTKQPQDEGTVRQNWGNPTPATIGGKQVFKGAGTTFYIPAAGEGRVLVAAPLTDDTAIDEWLKLGATQPALRRDLEVLARGSDAERHVTILFAPNFLFTGGKSLFSGPFERMKEPIQTFLSNDQGELPNAGALAFHIGDDLFAELRILGGADQKAPAELAREYRRRVKTWRGAFKSYMLSLNVSPYSKEILFQLPDMLAMVDEFTRAGSSDKQVVLRTYLPGPAASNLSFGTQLALVETPGGAIMNAGPTQPAGPKTLADKLKEKYTLAFDRDSLERTLEAISKDTGIPITIIGTDLQLEGITKNQSFGMDEKDKPIAEILKIIMKKANPDGKLIYVIKKEGNTETLFVTTRAAAAKRGDTVPADFQQ